VAEGHEHPLVIVNQTTADSGFFWGREKKKINLGSSYFRNQPDCTGSFHAETGKEWVVISVFNLCLANFRNLASKKKKGWRIQLRDF